MREAIQVVEPENGRDAKRRRNCGRLRVRSASLARRHLADERRRTGRERDRSCLRTVTLKNVGGGVQRRSLAAFEIEDVPFTEVAEST